MIIMVRAIAQPEAKYERAAAKRQTPILPRQAQH
jgi:hypothetical protein